MTGNNWAVSVYNSYFFKICFLPHIHCIISIYFAHPAYSASAFNSSLFLPLFLCVQNSLLYLQPSCWPFSFLLKQSQWHIFIRCKWIFYNSFVLTKWSISTSALDEFIRELWLIWLGSGVLFRSFMDFRHGLYAPRQRTEIQPHSLSAKNYYENTNLLYYFWISFVTLIPLKH